MALTTLGEGTSVANCIASANFALLRGTESGKFVACEAAGQQEAMPEISRFYGIVIGMFYDEHGPPHFHVRYGEHQAVMTIKKLVVTRGHLPPRALKLVVEWATKHREKLLRNWEAIENGGRIRKITPLE